MESDVSKLDSVFSSQGICDIIKVCAKSRVRSIKLGTLEIEFFTDTMVETQKLGKATINPHFEEKIEVKEELDVKRDRLALSLIEDPLEYERLLVAGDIEDAESTG